ELDAGGNPARARQQCAGHSRLCRALGRSGRRLLQGAGHQRYRPDGRPRDAAHLGAAHGQLALPQAGQRGAGRRDDETDGRRGGWPECRRPALPSDGARFRWLHRLPGRPRPGPEGPRAAERLYGTGAAQAQAGAESPASKLNEEGRRIAPAAFLISVWLRWIYWMTTTLALRPGRTRL